MWCLKKKDYIRAETEFKQCWHPESPKLNLPWRRCVQGRVIFAIFSPWDKRLTQVSRNGFELSLTLHSSYSLFNTWKIWRNIIIIATREPVRNLILDWCSRTAHKKPKLKIPEQESISNFPKKTYYLGITLDEQLNGN